MVVMAVLRVPFYFSTDTQNRNLKRSRHVVIAWTIAVASGVGVGIGDTVRSDLQRDIVVRGGQRLGAHFEDILSIRTVVGMSVVRVSVVRGGRGEGGAVVEGTRGSQFLLLGRCD